MGDSVNISKKQLELIEKVGVAYEKYGTQPAAARILSLLLVADIPELSFDQIREALNLSKSATSNAINILLKMNQIEYITKSGDRKRYFLNNISTWETQTQQSIVGMAYFANLLKEIEKQRPESTGDFNKKLHRAVEFMLFLEKEMSAILSKWEKRS